MSTSIIQTEPKAATETTSLLNSCPSVSSASSLRSTGSLSELNIVAPIAAFQINRQNKRICCNFSRNFQVRDHSKNEIILTAAQDNGLCSYCNNDYEDMHIYDVHDQLMFSIEFEDSIGYLSKQMKFSVVSSAKIGLGTVSRIWNFMESPRFEILNWDKEHLFSIGPPRTSGIKSYDFKRKYDIISNDGKTVAHAVQDKNMIVLKFEESVEVLQLRDKTLILALGFILDLLRNEEA